MNVKSGYFSPVSLAQFVHGVLGCVKHHHVGLAAHAAAGGRGRHAPPVPGERGHHLILASQ